MTIMMKKRIIMKINMYKMETGKEAEEDGKERMEREKRFLD